MKVGMIGEVTCLAKPLTIIPMVVTEIQDVIATGQVRATDQLVGVEQFSKPGTITVLMEPLYRRPARRPAAGVELHRQRLHEQLRGAPGPEHQLVPRLRAARHRRHRPCPRDDPQDAGADAADADARVLGRTLNERAPRCAPERRAPPDRKGQRHEAAPRSASPSPPWSAFAPACGGGRPDLHERVRHDRHASTDSSTRPTRASTTARRPTENFVDNANSNTPPRLL